MRAQVRDVAGTDCGVKQLVMVNGTLQGLSAPSRCCKWLLSCELTCHAPALLGGAIVVNKFCGGVMPLSHICCMDALLVCSTDYDAVVYGALLDGCTISALLMKACTYLSSRHASTEHAAAFAWSIVLHIVHSVASCKEHIAR